MPYSTIEARQISELCTVVDCEHKTAPYVDSSEYLVVRTSNVRNGQLLFDDMKFTTKDGYNEWTKRAIPEFGDVLFTREAPAGESCLVPSDKKVCMGQRMVMLRPKKNVTDPVFFSYILNTERTKADILRLSIGSTVSRINIADIKRLKVASPPLPEQRKIAKILSAWDKAISTNERLIHNSKQQKKALMQQLLTGKKRLFDDSGKPFEQEWEEVLVGNVAELTAGGTPSTKKSEYWGGDIPWMNSGEINLKQVFSVEGRITELGLHNSSTKQIPTNSVLIALAGQGKTRGTVAINRIELCTNQSIAAIMPNRTQLYPEFLYFNLDNRYQELRSMSTGDGGRGGFNLSILKSIRMKLPSISEQKKISLVLTNADKEIELLEQQLTDLKQEKKALMQQLLTGKRRVKLDDKEVA